MYLQGFPAATTLSGILCVTTLPEPITVLSPMLTPGLIIVPPPIQTLFPIWISCPNSIPVFLIIGSIG